MNKEQFIKLVIESLEAIEEPYRRPYENRPYERIICYEFYHQLRKRMDENCPFVLHGELDKRYRNIKKTPDFLFHIPHSDRRNFAIIEFKNVRSGVRWVKYDLRKIEEFMSFPLQYRIGLLVVFGKEDRLNRMYKKLQSLSIARHDLNVLFYDLNSGNVIKRKTCNQKA